MTAAYDRSTEIPAFIDHDEADDRLRELDPSLDMEVLRTAVVYAYRDHAAKTNVFSPPTAQGQEMYIHATTILRDQLCSERGWALDNHDNVACAISPSGKIRISCLNGGPGTGIKTAMPSVKQRGNGTLRSYTQGVLPGFEHNPFSPENMCFWYLLTYIDSFTGNIRAELSCPIISDDGVIRNWAQRINLGTFEQDATAGIPSGDSMPPSISVSRKAV